MIWLYLIVLVLSFIALLAVGSEWRRGARQGLIGPVSTFLIAFVISGLGVAWLHDLDRGRHRDPAGFGGPIPTDETGQGVPRRPGESEAAGVKPRISVTPGASSGWRSVVTPDFIAGALVTIIVAGIAQIPTTRALGRLHRSNQKPVRRLR